MTKPGGEIELSTSAVQGGVEVEISDTGVGIDERNLARIFEPFFTTKGEGKGTGLGLTIVQNLIDKHGGSVKVRSTLGRGTTFAIWLPAVVEPE
jgi:signal transduction histidine kinase